MMQTTSDSAPLLLIVALVLICSSAANVIAELVLK